MDDSDAIVVCIAGVSSSGGAGWGALVVEPDGFVEEHSGAVLGSALRASTIATVEALGAISAGQTVAIRANNRSLIHLANIEIPKWMKSSWSGSSDTPDIGLIKHLAELLQDLDVHWVQASSAHPADARTLALARKAASREAFDPYDFFDAEDVEDPFEDEQQGNTPQPQPVTSTEHVAEPAPEPSASIPERPPLVTAQQHPVIAANVDPATSAGVVRDPARLVAGEAVTTTDAPAAEPSPPVASEAAQDAHDLYPASEAQVSVSAPNGGRRDRSEHADALPQPLFSGVPAVGSDITRRAKRSPQRTPKAKPERFRRRLGLVDVGPSAKPDAPASADVRAQVPLLGDLANRAAIEEAMALDLGPRLVGYIDGRVAQGQNTGPGGWGFLLVDRQTGRAMGRRGGDGWTTPWRMEMVAAIEILKALRGRSQQIEIRTDEQRLVTMCMKWIPNWSRRNWTKRGGEEIKNLDLVRQLNALQRLHHITWRYLPRDLGEAGVVFADGLSRDALAARELSADIEKTIRFSKSPVQVLF